MLELAEREVGRTSCCGRRSGWEALDKVAGRGALGDSAAMLRERLVDEVRRRVRASWLQRGCSEAELGWTDDASSTRTC